MIENTGNILYEVSSVTREYPGCEGDEMTIIWVIDRQEALNFPQPWDMKAYTAHAVSGKFTEAEADLFVEYLKTLGLKADVVPVELPLEECVCISMVPTGGSRGLWPISDSSDYVLPFKVTGYFDKRQAWQKHQISSN